MFKSATHLCLVAALFLICITLPSCGAEEEKQPQPASTSDMESRGGEEAHPKTADTAEKSEKPKFEGRTIGEWRLYFSQADDAEKEELRGNDGLKKFALAIAKSSKDREFDGEFASACRLVAKLNMHEALPTLLERAGFRLYHPIGDKIATYSMYPGAVALTELKVEGIPEAIAHEAAYTEDKRKLRVLCWALFRTAGTEKALQLLDEERIAFRPDPSKGWGIPAAVAYVNLGEECLWALGHEFPRSEMPPQPLKEYELERAKREVELIIGYFENSRKHLTKYNIYLPELVRHLSGTVVPGMTKEQVLEILGPPRESGTIKKYIEYPDTLAYYARQYNFPVSFKDGIHVDNIEHLLESAGTHNSWAGYENGAIARLAELDRIDEFCSYLQIPGKKILAHDLGIFTVRTLGKLGDARAVPYLAKSLEINRNNVDGSESATLHSIARTELIWAIQLLTGLKFVTREDKWPHRITEPRWGEKIPEIIAAARKWCAENDIYDKTAEK